MSANLWAANSPQAFWQLDASIDEETWGLAIARAAPVLGLPCEPQDVGDLLQMTLGEGQFGPRHFALPAAKRLYYRFKPVLPRCSTNIVRRVYGRAQVRLSRLEWPCENRYPLFLLGVIRELLEQTGLHELRYRHFWPGGAEFALVLTHDVETAAGMQYVRAVADLDESYGFRSSFNLVTESYPLDRHLLQDLEHRGFEVGVHGIKHDGRLFLSPQVFAQRAERINEWLAELGAVGFRAPFTMRHPEWMQALRIEYDSSFFDTDPYQPVSGGTMCLWPFFLGHFVELPYTLSQDCVLVRLRRETTPETWLRKVDMLSRYGGMALVNSHPDYLCSPACRRVYEEFLREMAERVGCWHALPRDVARWWKQRASGQGNDATWGTLAIGHDGEILLDRNPACPLRFAGPPVADEAKEMEEPPSGSGPRSSAVVSSE
ncbi:MAG: hypothetical protein GX649_08370 [Chloroflexi bacterium]|nr:hypothetical protein [Chloroflexota bacterium]